MKTLSRGTRTKGIKLPDVVEQDGHVWQKYCSDGWRCVACRAGATRAAILYGVGENCTGPKVTTAGAYSCGEETKGDATR